MLRFIFLLPHSCVFTKMNNIPPVPVFGGNAENFASFCKEVELWASVTHLPSNRGAPASALAMHKMPREICLALGADALKSDTVMENIMEARQNNQAPDASDAAYREIFIIPGLRRSHLSLGEFSVHFHLARRLAAARLSNGAISPDAFLLSLSIRNASLTQNEESMVSASCCDDLSVEAVKPHMRGILGQCGMGMKQDALLLKGDSHMANSPPLVASSNEDASDNSLRGEAQVAYEIREKRGRGRRLFPLPFLPSNRRMGPLPTG